MAFIPDKAPALKFVPDKPAVTAAPESSNPFVREGQGELSDVGDASDAAVTSLLNMPHHVWESIKDFLSSATGQGQVDRTPGPAHLSPTTQADLQPGPFAKPVIAGAKAADTALENASPVAHDLLHNTARVAGDVGDIAGAGGAVKGAAGGIADALAASRVAPPVTNLEDALKAVGYPSLPSKTEGVSPAAHMGASVVGESSLAPAQTLTSQAVTDVLARHEAGIPQDKPLDYANAAKARASGPGKIYNAAHDALPEQLAQDSELQHAIAGVGDTTSQLPKSPDVDALKQTMLAQPNMTRDELFSNISQARDRASRFYASDQPDAHAIGDAYQGVANAYEDFVGRQLAANPQSPVSLADWQNARTAFAKNYAVQSAIKGTSVDASKLATLQRKDPDRLTGGLQLIAEQHNRYPLSTGFGPTTLADSGIGSSGSVAGNTARHITGPMLGGGIGALIGGVPGAAVGTATGQLASAGLQNILRRVLAGSPENAASIARGAVTDPRLGSFFDQLSGETHPTAPGHEPLPPFPPPQGPLTLADELGAGGPHQSPGEGIPLADVLSHGVEQPPAPGLTAGPMGAPQPQGVPFTRNAAHEAGGLETGGPTLMDLLENLKDHPAVMSQGVPEDIMTRTAANNASGESSASMEAINRTRREQAQGQDRFLIDPDGKMWPIRGVEAADARAPKGSIIVQKGISGEPYTILDRGGLPRAHANGLLNRALAGGHGMTLMDLLEGGGG